MQAVLEAHVHTVETTNGLASEMQNYPWPVHIR